MMSNSAFVILAAGRGSRMGRVGESLHKALLPLSQKAILTHLIELGPPDAELIICTGYRSGQLRDYMALAHPGTPVTWVHVPGWSEPGGGPGASLLAAREAIGGRSLVVTSCDTLWDRDPTLWHADLESWAAHAPIPAGSAPERWCRLAVTGDRVSAVIDKSSGELGATRAYTGLAHIAVTDLAAFWRGIEAGQLLNGELRDPAGLAALAERGRLRGRRIGWLDTGDMMAYRRAVILRDGYDWSKSQEATWVLPSSGRVVKWWADSAAALRTAQRQRWLTEFGTSVSAIEAQRNSMLGLRYVPGIIGYDAVKSADDLTALLSSPQFAAISRPVKVDPAAARAACSNFYHLKTLTRVSMLRQPVRSLASDVAQQIRWDDVINHPLPSRFHGDFNLGNMIFDGQDWRFIDWRDSFDGAFGTLWGDYRYDAAKFLAGLRVRWDWARHGDFTPWATGRVLYQHARELLGITPGVEEIGVLSLLASAPLHEVPLDEVLVTRAAEWMSELRT
jgi:CTP:molybdopterin cytidylyltransferase MocA